MPCHTFCRSASLLGLVISLAGCGAHRSATRIAASPSHAPAYLVGRGPVVLWDSGHYNFGKVKNIEALRTWVSRDGYLVRPFGGQFDQSSLAEADIVVIRMALAAVNDNRGLAQGEPSKWVLPTPSAFSPSEIDALARWVRTGGALLLITDHMPFGGAVADLASAFGIEMSNSFAMDATAITAELSESVETAGSFVFRRGDGSLRSHPVTDGRTGAERIDSVVTDAGASCAFRMPTDGKSLLDVLPNAESVRL